MSTTTAPVTVHTDRPGVPFGRLVKVELRKMFNTRSGFWLIMSIAIIALLATIGVIAFVDDKDLTYEVFGSAVGFPMVILLPVVAILSVTSEWSQRTGLITFTLVPHRASIVGAKAVASVIVAVVSIVLAFAIGAIGNILGTTINGVDTVWDIQFMDFVYILLANVFGLLIGFMLGALIRNSAAAIVGYFVYSFVLPTIFAVLAELAKWFKDIQYWIDFNTAQSSLFEDGGPTGEQWAQIGTSSLIWFWVPMAIGIWAILRAEVK